MFDLLSGDKYRKYQTLFVQAKQENKSLVAQVRALQARVLELEEQVEAMTSKKTKTSTRRKQTKASTTAQAKTESASNKTEKELTDDRDTTTNI